MKEGPDQGRHFLTCKWGSCNFFKWTTDPQAEVISTRTNLNAKPQESSDLLDTEETSYIVEPVETNLTTSPEHVTAKSQITDDELLNFETQTCKCGLKAKM